MMTEEKMTEMTETGALAVVEQNGNAAENISRLQGSAQHLLAF